MAKTNYKFEKRQRDIAKQKKKEKKQRRKAGTQEEPEQPADGAPQPPVDDKSGE